MKNNANNFYDIKIFGKATITKHITKHISRAYLKDLYLIFPSEGVFIMNVIKTPSLEKLKRI